MTSSPGPISSSRSARWSAAVHELTATPYSAPGLGRDGLLELGDAGPLGDPARRNRVGGGLGLFGPEPRFHDGDHPACSASTAGAGSFFHHSTNRVSPSCRSISAVKPRRSRAAARRGEAPGRDVDVAGRAVFGLEVGIHDFEERSCQTVETRLGLARDVEHLVGDVALRREQVGPRDVVDVDEVHRLAAVAEDQRRLARGDALHPAHEHLGVDAVDVHPRSVHVEVAQGHVVEAVHRVVAAEGALEEHLQRAVQRGVRVGVVVFLGGEVGGLAVDRGRRRGDDLVDLACDRGVEHVHRAAAQDVEREARILGALGDADRGLVEHDVDAAGGVHHHRRVAEIAFDHRDRAAVDRRREVRHAAPREVVEHADLFGLERDQLVGDRRADESGAARDQDRLPLQHRCLSGRGSRPLENGLRTTWSSGRARDRHQDPAAGHARRGGLEQPKHTQACFSIGTRAALLTN